MKFLKLHAKPCTFSWVEGLPLSSDNEQVFIYSNGLVTMGAPLETWLKELLRWYIQWTLAFDWMWGLHLHQVYCFSKKS